VTFQRTDWAVILGGSSGFGLASAKKLGSLGMSLCVVHRDLRGAMARIEPEFEAIRASGTKLVALNLDALSSEGLSRTVDVLKDSLGEKGRVKVLLHSIAHGNLKPLAGTEAALSLQDEDFAHTVYAMGTSLATWAQSLWRAGLFSSDGRVLALTSEGSHVAWPGYAAVSAAKAALEAVSRSLAVELGPLGVRSNVIQAGVTDTPALRRIPGSDKMKSIALKRNPLGRLTTPEDVAGVVALLARPEAAWINGAILRVDGGEAISSLREGEL
jgi:NAD(P)-dependent dehydrogenase (short-subunit alcohol dehydrogenase family)